MNTLFVISIASIPLALFAIYASRSIKNESASTDRLLNAIRANPDCVEAVRVSDNDPITAEVKLIGADWQVLSGIHGVPAVRLFDAIRAFAPTAEVHIQRNGRPVALDEFDSISRLQWPTAV